MAVKLFNRIGLRRDFNLADLVNQESALNNILATDSMSGGDPFTVDDIAPIKNIYITDITAETFLTLDGILVQFTNILIDEDTGLPKVDNDGNPEPYKPFVKIKNRLDTAYFTTGEPFFFGGDGPRAIYYDARNIIRQPDALVLNAQYQIGDIVLSNNNIYRVIQADASTNATLSHVVGSQDGFLFERQYDVKEVFFNGTYDVLTGEERTESDNFWERGFFLYGNKIRDSYLSSLGGVKWTGYFKPTVSGTHRFNLRSSGNCQFRFQDPSTLSSVETKYGQPEPTFLSNYLLNNPSLDPITQSYIVSLEDLLNDNTKKFVEVRLENSLQLATDDLVYIDSLQGQLVSKQYRIFTLRPSQIEGSVDRLWIDVTADFNRKQVNIGDLPVFGNAVWADATGNRSYIRYYPYKRRTKKTYLNSIYKTLEIPSSEFTATTSTITFAGPNSDLYYYQLMQNDYIYDYRQRGTESQGVRRFIVTGLSDSTKTATVEIDTSYNGVADNSNNDQVARFDGQDLYVFPEEFGGSPPFGNQITSTYITGSPADTISGTTRTNNLHFVARFGESGENLREKNIIIDQFIPKFEEHAFELSFFMKDEDIKRRGKIEEKGIIIWYSDENSGYDPVSYKYFYDPDYEFYQIGDFKTFLDNTVGFGGTSREIGIEQRAFGKPQLLAAGDQYKTFYTTLPLQSVYTPKTTWNDIAILQTSNTATDTRKLNIQDVVNIEVGNYVIPQDIAAFNGTGSLVSRGTRVIENIADQAGANGDAIISKILLQDTTNTPMLFLDHRGFVTTLQVRSKGGASNNEVYLKAGLPEGACKFAHGTISVRTVGDDGSTNQIGSFTTSSTSGNSGSGSGNGATFNYSSDTDGVTITGPGIGQIFRYKTYVDGMDDVTSGMIIVSNQDPVQSDQTVYRRVIGYQDNNNDGEGFIYYNNPVDNLVSGDMLSVIYYDKGIDIVKPLESYCSGVSCNQNAYQNEVVTNNDGESQIVTFTNTKYIAPLIHESDQSSLDSSTNSHPNSDTIQFVDGNDTVRYWFDSLNQRNDDYEPTESTNSLYKDDVIHIQLSTTDQLQSAIDEKGFPNTAQLTGNNDYIPIARVIGFIKVKRGNNFVYHYIARVNPKAYTWLDTEQDDNQNVLSKKIDWTKFNTSDYWIQKWSHKDGGSRIGSGSNITVKTGTNGLTNYQSSWAGSSSTTEEYRKVTGSFVVTDVEASDIFHNPNSVPVSGNGPSRVLSANSFVRRALINGVRKLIYFNEFSEFQGAYSVYGKNPTTVTNNLGTNSQRVQPIINMQNQQFSDARRTSTNVANDPFEYIQFRSKIYEIVVGNSQVESIIPFVRFAHPFSISGTENRIQNTMNALTVYTFTNTTTNRELCCPPLDTSPPFDSSAIGLSTTLSEPDMGVAGGLNVRIISARHPVADILEIPAGITTSDLAVDKKLRIDFNGSKYDLLIGDTIPFTP